MVWFLIFAFLIDTFWGEYSAKYHPVVWIGKTAQWWKCRFYHEKPILAFVSGAAMTLSLIGLWGGFAYLISFLPGPIYFLGSVFILKSTFSFSVLLEAGRRILSTLANGDLTKAKKDLLWLCSRDSDGFHEYDFVNGAISSIAENLSDSLVAPILWYLLFGLEGALVYRVVNTLDAKFGYKNRELEYFGKFPARLDDLMNLMPARLTSVLIILVSIIMRGYSGYYAFKAAWNDGMKTPSPNSGWPMAAVAGSLDVTLRKPGSYQLFLSGRKPYQLDLLHALDLIRITGYSFIVCTILGVMIL